MRQRILLLASCWAASGLLLNPEEQEEDSEVRVLVFGDSWGAWGPSWHMVNDLLNRKGVKHNVKSSAISGTRACSWAKHPTAIVQQIHHMFQGQVPHFIWYTLGGNDLLDPSAVGCSAVAKSEEQALECVMRNGNKSKTCTMTMLDHLWEKFPDVKVIQLNYDIVCFDTVGCSAQPRTVYCGYDKGCSNRLMYTWGLDLCASFTKRYGHTGKYKCLDTFGTGQFAASLAGASPGHPDLTKGTPCKTMEACVHPKPKSLHTHKMGEVMWQEFFSTEIPESLLHPAQFAPEEEPPLPPDNATRDEEENRADLEVIDTYCNYNWDPTPGVDSLSPPPPCLHSRREMLSWSR